MIEVDQPTFTPLKIIIGKPAGIQRVHAEAVEVARLVFKQYATLFDDARR